MIIMWMIMIDEYVDDNVDGYVNHNEDSYVDDCNTNNVDHKNDNWKYENTMQKDDMMSYECRIWRERELSHHMSLFHAYLMNRDSFSLSLLER